MTSSLKKLKIVFFGSSSFVTSVLKALEDNFLVVAVVTSPDQRKGRKQELTHSPVRVAYRSYIEDDYKPNFPSPIFTPQKLDHQFIQDIKIYQPDLLVVASYGQILPQEILDLPKYGALNVHPSLLPKYRGASPIPAAILNGDKTSGVTIIRMDAQMDHGPIVATEDFRFSEQDTFQTLSKKMFEVGAKMLVKIIPDFVAEKIKLRTQDHSKATFCSRIKKEDGYFDLNNPPPPEKLDRMIRAYYPWPNVWTLFNKKIVKFYPNGVVQMEGKKPVLLADFLRGYPNFPIKKLSLD